MCHQHHAVEHSLTVQVWPTDTGLITATALDPPPDLEEGSSPASWHTTIVHAEPSSDGDGSAAISFIGEPSGSGSGSGQDSSAADSLQELSSHLDHLLQRAPCHLPWGLRCWLLNLQLLLGHRALRAACC